MADYIYGSGAGRYLVEADALKARCSTARRYLGQRHWRRVARLQRLLAGAVLLFVWAVVLALLVGAAWT